MYRSLLLLLSYWALFELIQLKLKNSRRLFLSELAVSYNSIGSDLFQVNSFLEIKTPERHCSFNNNNH